MGGARSRTGDTYLADVPEFSKERVEEREAR